MSRRDRAAGHPTRVQARRASGRFTTNTLENMHGTSVHICKGAPGDWCGAFNPTRADAPAPEKCHRCGRPLVLS